MCFKSINIPLSWNGKYIRIWIFRNLKRCQRLFCRRWMIVKGGATWRHFYRKQIKLDQVWIGKDVFWLDDLQNLGIDKKTFFFFFFFWTGKIGRARAVWVEFSPLKNKTFKNAAMLNYTEWWMKGRDPYFWKCVREEAF